MTAKTGCQPLSATVQVWCGQHVLLLLLLQAMANMLHHGDICIVQWPKLCSAPAGFLNCLETCKSCNVSI
jgi:hypothetical protein